MPIVSTKPKGSLAQARAALELKQRESTMVIEGPEFFQWVKDEVWIEDPHKIGATEIKFNLWQAQIEYLSLIMRVSQTIALKARQLGVSWCVIIYCLWLCIFHANVSVYVMSKDLDAAKEVIRRARFTFKRLKFKPVREKGRGDNQQEIKFSNGSRFKAFPATANAATSFTATFLIVDEADKMEHGKDLYTSIKPTIDDGGRIAIIFTAYGADGLGRLIWGKAGTEADGASIIRYFIPWWGRISRTQEWYNKVASEAISLAHHRQEYPATPEEALGFTNLDSRFIKDIKAWSSLQSDSIPNPYAPCVLALDAGVDSDNFAAVTACWDSVKRIPSVRDTQLWVPKETETGQLDLNEIYDWVRKFIKTRKVLRTVYDPYQMAAFGQDLAKTYDVKAFSQGTARLDADTRLKQSIMRGEVTHDGQPDLAEHISNADVKIDSQGARLRLIKRSPAHKIDLAVATSMAVYELTTQFPFSSFSGSAPMSSATLSDADLTGQAERRAFDGMPDLIYSRVRR